MSAERHLDTAPSIEEILCREITEICAQIDRRLSNPPGTAERGVYLWLWPPAESIGPDVLTEVHAAAVDFLSRHEPPVENIQAGGCPDVAGGGRFLSLRTEISATRPEIAPLEGKPE